MSNSLKIKQVKLVEQAKKEIDLSNLENFKSIITKKYKKIEYKEVEVVETVGSYELGLVDQKKITYVPEKVLAPILDIQHINELFSYARNHIKGSTLEWITVFYNYGLRLDCTHFKAFCKNNASDKSSKMEAICMMHVKEALKKNDFSLTKIILGVSPVYKDNKLCIQYLDAIKPLFNNLKEIHTKIWRNRWYSPELNVFSSELREIIGEFITNKIDYKEFEKRIEHSAQTSIDDLESECTAWKLIKNVLLALTLIGPLLKKICGDGLYFYENSITSKVRAVKNTAMKLKLFDADTPKEERNPDEELSNNAIDANLTS